MTAESASGSPLPAVTPAVQSDLERYIDRLLMPEVTLRPADVGFLAVAALGLGILLDVLFRAGHLGINLPIWLASVAAVVAYATRRCAPGTARSRLLPFAGAVVIAAGAAWRDSPILQLLNLLGAIGLLGVGMGLPEAASLRRLSPTSFLVAAARAGSGFLTSELRLGMRVPWGTYVHLRGSTRSRSIARGLLIALPLFVVFAALFASADAVFAEAFGRLFQFDLSGIVPHVAWVLFGLWIATAVLWNVVGVAPPADADIEVPARHRLKRVEMAIILGSLTVLFLAFVGVQVRYLFGGEDVVQHSVNLTYAEYGRRGFFELVAASLLLLGVLAAANWAREQDAAATRLFLALSAALTALVFVIMVSAWQRLGLYREVFGLTELRFYTAAMLPWIGVTLLWFLVTVALNRPREFCSGAVASALLMGILLNAVNPDSIIAATNATRADFGKEFDAQYLTTLSADAVPALLDRLASVPAASQCLVATAILDHAEGDHDVRSWNYSREHARALIAANRPALAGACLAAPGR